MDNYLVLDNFTPLSLQNHIEQCLMLNDQVNWGYRPETGGVQDNWDKTNLSIKENFQFEHTMYAYDNQSLYSPFFDISRTNIYLIEQMFGPIDMLQRMKANLLIKDISSVAKYHPPHIDSVAENSFSMVYYVNDADGDTIFFDRLVDVNINTPQHTGLTEIGRVTPKKGRAVIFNSNRFHASSNPIVNNRRVVINSVFLASPEFIANVTKYD
jgi:hypothetical protein